jgi:hypothetical protein
VATEMLTEELPLTCGMCGRRICDITVINGRVALLYAPPRLRLPQQVPSGYRVKSLGPPHGQTRNPNVRIFADEARGHLRIVHVHKRNRRGPLDRTVSAATLHKLHTDAVDSNAHEVVLR